MGEKLFGELKTPEDIKEAGEKPANTTSEKEKKKGFDFGYEKLEKELENLIAQAGKKKEKMAREQFGLVFSELIKKCKEDSEFDELVNQPHKSWERCYKFMEKKAQEIAISGAMSCAVISTTLFEWIEQYYRLDDKAEIEKEKEVSKKTANSKKKPATSNSCKPKAQPKTVVKETQKTDRKEKKFGLDGQFSLFDFM